MAGVFQHHIPQSLIRGFRVPGGSKKKSKVWFFENGRAPRLELVKDIGGEPYFYSELPTDGAKTLDDKITDYETVFDRYFRKLKATPVGQAVDSRQASEVVAHLTIRNAHLRQIFSLGLESIYSGSASLFGNEVNLRPILGVDEKTPSEKLREAVDEQIAQNPQLSASGVPARVLYKIVQMALQENFNQLFTDQIPQFITMLSQLASDAPRLAREAHNNALAVATPDGRIQLLEVLSWSVQTASDISFILPDCVALGLDKKSGLQSLMGADLKDVQAVLMPLSPTKMLVGFRAGAPLPNLQDFNRAAAASSNSFFVAACECEKFREFQASIATSTSHFMEEAMGAAFGQFAKERGLPADVGNNPTEEVTIDSIEVGLPETPTPTAPNYTVNFFGCADRETAERIAATLNSVTLELVRLMPLDRLDGVTFAHDYPAALRDLDRGFVASAPLQPTCEDYGVGIAMAPLVVREGVPKTHIVMRGDIGHCLIDDDEVQWRFALHTVVQQLAHVSCMQILDETLPGVLLSRLPDPYAAFLYPFTEAAWEGYFTCRASATFKIDAGEGYVELLISVLKRAQADIRAAKLTYHFNNDMNRLMSVVLPRINDILRFAGNVLGHSDGLSQSFTKNEHLADELDKVGLLNWFTLFDNELSELWSRSGSWTSIDEFLHLNRHVERLFWQFRLIPWKTDDEKIWVQVIMDAEAEGTDSIAAS